MRRLSLSLSLFHTHTHTSYLQEHLQCVFYLWPDICVYRVHSRAAPVSKILHFISLPSRLVKASSCEHRVIPFLLMKGAPLTLQHPPKLHEGGEGTPLKDRKLGALHINILWLFFCIQVLHLATSLQVNDLRGVCEEALKRQVHIANIISTYHVARKFRLPNLEEYALNYMQVCI